VHAQRIILVVALVLATGYVWLRGGFIGLFDDSYSTPVFVSIEATTGVGASQEELVSEHIAPLEIATLAAGCFWCVEADFDKLEGVIATISGYTGGSTEAPSYSEVSRGGTGHTEAVQVLYDSTVVSYDEILDHYWRNVDPFVVHRQFCDVGNQYRPELFYHSEAQRDAAERSKSAVQEYFEEPIIVAVSPAGLFFKAEEYHQDYYQKNPLQYRFYRWGCGRDARLTEIWRIEKVN
jgi:peptide-methionine (S)-S-oxide reductase